MSWPPTTNWPGSSRSTPSNKDVAVTRLVLSVNRRLRADRPSAAVAATPPQAPINQMPTRRSLMKIIYDSSRNHRPRLIRVSRTRATLAGNVQRRGTANPGGTNHTSNSRNSARPGQAAEKTVEQRELRRFGIEWEYGALLP